MSLISLIGNKPISPRAPGSPIRLISPIRSIRPVKIEN